MVNQTKETTMQDRIHTFLLKNGAGLISICLDRLELICESDNSRDPVVSPIVCDPDDLLVRFQNAAEIMEEIEVSGYEI
jgi:hypothetical protein